MAYRLHTPPALAGECAIMPADAAIEAIREGLDLFLDERGSASDPVLTIETARGCLGHLYLRRSVWAAYSVTGTCVGVFATAREASAALGGRS